MKLIFARNRQGAVYGCNAYYTPDYEIKVWKRQTNSSNNNTWWISGVSGYTPVTLQDALYDSGLSDVQFRTRREATQALEAFLQSLGAD